MNTKQKHEKNDIRSGQTLAVNALDSLPKAKSGAASITGLLKRGGKISGYQLSDGRTVSKEEGVTLAQNGEIAGVGIAHRGDTKYLKSIPDGSDQNNLGNLPTV